MEAFGRCRREFEELEKQLHQLQAYRKDYMSNRSLIGRPGFCASELIEFNAFIDKLDQAIAGQQQQLTYKKTELNQLRMVWEQKYRKVRGLEKVHDKALSEEQLKMRKMEQAEQDEHASRKGRRNGTGNA